MNVMIDARGLSKTFTVIKRRSGRLGSLRSIVNPEKRVVFAVQNLSLQVERGEIIGLVGPNGAGKSTMIKMLTGILMPTSGSVQVAGLIPIRQRRELAARIGVVFGQRTQLWWDLPLIDSLQLLRHLYRVPEQRHQENLQQLRTLLDLDEFIHTPVRQLSLGQRVRGDLAAALLHEPELLYLDEPTIGLDVVAKARVRDFLRTLNAQKKTTVLITTHDMDDIEALCPRIVIIDHGRKLYDGTVANIRARFGGERTLMAVLNANELATITSLPKDTTDLPILPGLPQGVHVVQIDGPRLGLNFGQNTLPAHELVAWLGARYSLHDVTFLEPQIEDIIRRIYEEGLLLNDSQEQ
jgi:ABC-2 type transport system ATP-binding protein